MDNVLHFINYVDRKSPSILYRAETIVALGTLVAITEIFFKTICSIIALFTERHRCSHLVNYLEGKTVVELLYLLDPFWKRRTVIEDRQGPQDFDKGILEYHPRCRNLEVFADLWNTMKNDPAFINKTISLKTPEQWLNDFQPHLEDQEMLIEIIKINPPVLSKINRTMLGENFNTESFFLKIALLDEPTRTNTNLWTGLISIFPLDCHIYLKDPDRLIEIIKKDPAFLTCLERPMLGENFDSESFFKKIMLFDTSFHEKQRINLWIHLIRLFPHDKVYEKIEKSLKTSFHFAEEISKALIKTPESEEELCRLIYLDDSIYYFAKTWAKKKDLPFVLDTLDRGIPYHYQDSYWNSQKGMEQLLLGMEPWTWDQQKKCVEQIAYGAPKVLSESIEHLITSKAIAKIDNKAYTEWKISNNPSGNLAALSYALKNDPEHLLTFRAIGNYYPYLNEELRRCPENLEGAVVDLHKKLIFNNSGLWEVIDPSWKTQEFINLLFAKIDPTNTYILGTLINDLSDLSVDFLIEAMGTHCSHLLDIKCISHNSLKDGPVQKILKAAASPNKNQYQQLAVCCLLLKISRGSKVFISNLDLMMKDGTFQAMTSEEFSEWQKQNSLFAPGIFHRHRYYDCSSLEGLQANMNNLAAIHYGFTQTDLWMNASLKKNHCSFLSPAENYPYFGDVLTNDEKFNAKAVVLDHKVFAELKPAAKTKSFFHHLFLAWSDLLHPKWFIRNHQKEFFIALKKNEPSLYFMCFCDFKESEYNFRYGHLLLELKSHVKEVDLWRKNAKKMAELTNKDSKCLQYADQELFDKNFILDIPLENRIKGIFQADFGFLNECRKTTKIFLLCRKRLERNFNIKIPRVLVQHIIGCMLLHYKKSHLLWAK